MCHLLYNMPLASPFKGTSLDAHKGMTGSSCKSPKRDLVLRKSRILITWVPPESDPKWRRALIMTQRGSKMTEIAASSFKSGATGLQLLVPDLLK